MLNCPGDILEICDVLPQFAVLIKAKRPKIVALLKPNAETKLISSHCCRYVSNLQGNGQFLPSLRFLGIICIFFHGSTGSNTLFQGFRVIWMKT